MGEPVLAEYAANSFSRASPSATSERWPEYFVASIHGQQFLDSQAKAARRRGTETWSDGSLRSKGRSDSEPTNCTDKLRTKSCGISPMIFSTRSRF